MPSPSAGLLIYRQRPGRVEVFLVHPGGPYWAKKDLGAWSIPKGEHAPDEDPLEAARREFCEETGLQLPAGEFTPLEPVRLASGKWVRAWAVPGDIDAQAIRSNTFSIEWPPRSGRQQSFPEVDQAEWFALPEARHKINQGQRPLLDQLGRMLNQPRENLKARGSKPR